MNMGQTSIRVLLLLLLLLLLLSLVLLLLLLKSETEQGHALDLLGGFVALSKEVSHFFFPTLAILLP